MERSQRVRDVEPPLQAKRDSVERRLVRRERDRVGKLLRQPPSVVVADIDDRERPRLDEEEPPLRLEVRLHVAVEIEVVLAEIREHEHREAHTVEPMQDGRVRRRLHRARPVADVEHLAEQPLQVDRLRSRPHDAAALAADAGLHRPQQPRPTSGSGEDRKEEMTRRRLAARPRHTHDLQLSGRLAEEGVCRDCHRRARVAD